MIAGLTGGIATGKSTVSRMLQERGAAIVDADVIARQVVEPGTEGLRRIKERFGQEVLQPDGTLDRKALGAIVFRDPAARRELNRLLHPLIIDQMQEETRQAQRSNPARPVILDTPLLIEEKLTSLVEKVIVVYIPEALQLQRLMAREGMDEKEARRLIQSQIPIEEKKQFADVLIDNSGTLADTERQVDQLWETLVLQNGSDQP
ncbi:dephospho-CoA kinase [Marinithermofilum abyssi]|uniref:Dephospho-CoA kinase n=1 Tax=Marinithermofilum abyssi TaxID=1571185 RepID=A0A8J2VI29_9BACL|nr:dephospho-CoA kinase [Marinithermofilum abyssi]GGE17556.1 dephospho-CoA kinase [Marinithermofilum abyssi]